MKLATWKNSGKYFTYKDYKIFYKESGTGDPLLLTLGFPTSSWDWNKVWDSLSKQYKVYAMDMLGYGFSSKPSVRKYSVRH